MATHSSFLAWRIPWTLYPWDHTKLDMTELLSLFCQSHHRHACDVVLMTSQPFHLCDYVSSVWAVITEFHTLMNNRALFLTVLETKRSKIKCLHVWCLMRARSLVHRWLRPHWILMWLKGWGSTWGLSFKGMNPSMTLCPHDLPVVQLLSRVWLFVTPGTVACCQTSLSFTVSWSLLRFISIVSVMPSNHLILCRPLLLLPSIFPSLRVFSNESTLHIRWPKYSSLNFSICPRGLTNPQRHHFQILSHWLGFNIWILGGQI